MKYKVGQKLRVKSLQWFKNNCNNKDRREGNVDYQFEQDIFAYEMIKYCGKTVTIRSIEEFTNKEVFYTIEGDVAQFSWYTDWFMPLTKAGKILYD